MRICTYSQRYYLWYNSDQVKMAGAKGSKSQTIHVYATESYVVSITTRFENCLCLERCAMLGWLVGWFAVLPVRASSVAMLMAQL